MPVFERPAQSLAEQSRFSPTEVGLSHQHRDAYVRLNDDGDVEICAAPGLAVILHPQNKSITMVADSIKFITAKNGLRWNNLAFNDQAFKFQEPTFVVFDHSEVRSIYTGLEEFWED